MKYGKERVPDVIHPGYDGKGRRADQYEKTYKNLQRNQG